MENDDDLLAKIVFSDEATFPLKWKDHEVQCEDMGEWKSALHYGGWTWLSKTQCVLCRIKAECVRPVHLWGTNRYWPKVPGNANQMVDSTTSCWETWLPFSARWGATALASLVRMFLNDHLPNRWIGRAGQNDQVFCKWPPKSPDRLWLFPLGVREGQSLCTSTTRNYGWAAGTHHCSCQLGHAGYAAESLVRARLSHRCLLSNKRGAHWVCLIPHDFITTWNQGVFLWSPCTMHVIFEAWKQK